MIQIMIADDHGVVRDGLKKLIESDSSFALVGEASSGRAAIEMANECNPDVILMDIKMPDMDGLQATKKILASHPEIKILALTSVDNELIPKEMLDAGARGYVTKKSGDAELIRAIKTVALGQFYIETSIATRLTESNIENSKKRGKRRHGQAIDSPFDRLAAREMEVVMLTVTGKTTKEIGEKYGISTKTVNSNRYRTFEKLGIKNDIELTLMALRHGLIDANGRANPKAVTAGSLDIEE